jgi:hypothetical protein
MTGDDPSVIEHVLVVVKIVVIGYIHSERETSGASASSNQTECSRWTSFHGKSAIVTVKGNVESTSTQC